MARLLAGLLTALAVALPVCAAPPAEEKGPYLGVLFASVPEILYDHVPNLPQGSGVAVTHVLPDSPAVRAGLRRHDVLIRYDGEAIRDPEHFARLIQAGKPGQKVKLTLVRAGKETTAEATLALGPVLRIAPARGGAYSAARDGNDPARAFAKPNGPAPVSVSAQLLGGGQMKVSIEYYQDGTGRLRTVTCSGTPAEIDAEVKKKLPAAVQVLARPALERLRKLDLQNASAPPPPAPAKER
ncbi:MAG TPA: PDZ domain-containing protein [Gemmataceae bacterium]|nr:PDZ domain-containing protein [Gemmataceae bacterium]